MTNEILIIDDNPDIRNILNDLIRDAGYKTRVAANYGQALAEIDKKLPDVAIIDVKLDKGDNDGIQLLNHIKNKNNEVPVIIISGHANIEMAIKSLKSGAFEFIQKPFDQERLMNFVNRAVENFEGNIKDILNPYFTTKKKGTGLGLSIVNKIVNDHDGSIDFIPLDIGAKVKIIFLKK